MDYFIFIHPRVDVRFSASSLAKDEKSSLYRQILYLFLIFQESICAKLGGTMKVLEIKWFNFSNFISPSMTKCFYLLKLVSRPLLVKIGSMIEGENDFKNSFKI